ncbi:pseudouridine synthase [Patiriisocius marinistellae]|uniref:Pseudouridine synthase n=1 Tax=Patiriisocius marinistellae TaxID=2494560 RepID=A0A5J4G0I9_9FLAO|nr:RluA family pseudouridine synthase [Patiriisocius marinistellae]GEQ85825.1 pseudouridine synthase [Patiriisocius marinistellae]
MINKIIQTHIATPQEHPLRLQEYGVAIFNLLPTKSALKKALKKNQITINGEPATTATFIYGGEKLVFTSETVQREHKSLELKLEVVFEDEHLAIINKPPGILVSGNTFKTVANALINNVKPSKLPTATIPQPVHRLDYPTTGCLLVGKTTNSIIALNKLFEDKAITKTYIAITIDKMPKIGIIDVTIDDKAAVSEFRVLKSVVSERFSLLNLVEVFPQTGRRHQIRKHLSYIKNPILGDVNYGNEPHILKGKGLYLHASSLKFKHPFTTESMEITIPVPKKFKNIFPKYFKI